MADDSKITNNLLEMYGRDDFITRYNFRHFMKLSGLRDIPRDSRIVDCGCAMGHFIKILKEYGFSDVTGLDASLEMVKAAHELTASAIIHADAVEIAKNFKAGSVDVIIASDLIHHLESADDWDAFLTGCSSVLNTGGMLILREPYPNVVIRLLYWMSKYKIFHFGFLKARLQSFVEESSLLQYFFKNWVKDYPKIIDRHGFEIKKDIGSFVHRITACQKR